MRKTAIALLAFALVAAIALPLTAAEMAKGSWTGWITDSHCGAKGANAKHTADCVKKCAHEGGKVVFFNEGDQKLYGLDKQDEAVQHVGHQVKVTGTLDGENIKVDTIEMAGK
jgi:uncharacterized protein DUF5818